MTQEIPPIIREALIGFTGLLQIAWSSKESGKYVWVPGCNLRKVVPCEYEQDISYTFVK